MLTNEAAPVNRSDAASASGEAGAACAAAGFVATERSSVPAANASAAGAASDFAYQAELASMKAAKQRHLQTLCVLPAMACSLSLWRLLTSKLRSASWRSLCRSY